MSKQDDWRCYKKCEENYRARRLEVEQEILDELAKPEDYIGSASYGGLKVTYKLNESIDVAELQEVSKRASISPERMRELFRWKPSKDAKEWKAATDEERGALSRAITLKPAKPGFVDKGE